MKCPSEPPRFYRSARAPVFVRKHKSVLDKLATTDIDPLTPIEAIDLLSQIKSEIGNE